MKTAVFKEIWDSVWPHRALNETALHLFWGPHVTRVQADPAVAFLRAWAEQNPWPPSLHEFLVGTGLQKPRASVTPATDYACEFCGRKIRGSVAYGEHIQADHPEAIASADQVAAALDGWRPNRPPVTAAPEPPAGGTKPPGCTLCGDKAPGLLFRLDPDGAAVAALCWGCEALGCRNPHHLPPLPECDRGDFKRFEHAFPERKGLRKAQRVPFVLAAVQRALAQFRAAAAGQPKETSDQDDSVTSEPPPL